MPQGEYSGDDVTLVPGFLRGFRAWGLGFQFNVPTLTGVVQTGYPWQPGLNEGDCLVKRSHAMGLTNASCGHPTPSPNCACGLYARFVDDQHRYIGVKGIVKATGNVILGTKGFRAQYAQIEAFYVDGSVREYLDAARGNSSRLFGLGLQPFSNIPSWARCTPMELLELFASDYGVKIYDSAAAAREAFPFPSVEGLLPPEPEPEPGPAPNPYVRTWPFTTPPLVWGPPQSPYRGERKKLKPIPYPNRLRHWRTK